MNTRRFPHSLLRAALLAAGLMGALQAGASVVVGGTRVVYPAQERETTLRLTNAGNTPALTQAWIDNGDPKAQPSAIDVPFTVTPPLSRVDPGKGQTLRIVYTGEPLPTDRESVFWLNVVEIPPKSGADEAGVNTLQLAIRTRIKLFFRPAALAGTAQDAPAKAEWRWIAGGRQPAVEVRNPTPYYVSFASFEVPGNGKPLKFDDGGMVAPGEARVFPLRGEAAPGPDPRVVYHAISDYGGAIDGEAVLRLP